MTVLGSSDVQISSIPEDIQIDNFQLHCLISGYLDFVQIT